jgi:hypothetical protein
MKRNFNELFSKMKPESQERVKARSAKLLQDMDLATAAEDLMTPSADVNETPSDKASPERLSAKRKVALQSSK